MAGCCESGAKYRREVGIHGFVTRIWSPAPSRCSQCKDCHSDSKSGICLSFVKLADEIHVSLAEQVAAVRPCRPLHPVRDSNERTMLVCVCPPSKEGTAGMDLIAGQRTRWRRERIPTCSLQTSTRITRMFSISRSPSSCLFLIVDAFQLALAKVIASPTAIPSEESIP